MKMVGVGGSGAESETGLGQPIADFQILDE